MRKINQIITLAVLLVFAATRAAGQTYTSGQFKYELDQAGGETYAYITGLANSSSTVSSITIPGSIEHSDGKSYFTFIAANAFKENAYLTDITVNYGCRVIFNNAFAYCPNLKTLRLPSSITALWTGIVNGSAQDGLTVYSAMTAIPNTHTGAWMGIPKNKSKFYTFSSETRELFVWNDEYYNYFGNIWKETVPQYACDYRNTRGQLNCYVVTKQSTATSDGEMMLIGTYRTNNDGYEVSLGETGYMFDDYKVTGHKTYVTKVMEGAYFQKNVTAFSCSSSRIKEIGTDAFRESSLQEVHISNTTRSSYIREKAFYGCEDLTTVYVDTYCIKDSAFCDCTALDDLTLAEGVQIIYENAFRCCNELTELNIPASLHSLLSTNISEIMSWTKSWGGFHLLPNLKKITVAEGNPLYSAYDNLLYNKDKTKLYFCPRGIDIIPTFPSTLKTIGFSAFDNVRNPNWTKLEIPYGVTTIEEYAVEFCQFKYVKFPSTATMTSPSETIFIYDCTEIISLGKAAFTFDGNDKLQIKNAKPENIYVPAGDHQQSTISGHAALYRLYNDNNVYSWQGTVNISYGAYDVLTPNGIPLLLDEQTKTAKVVYGRFDQDYTALLSGVVTIPETYTYRGTTYTITAIDMHAFEGNNSITEINIPSTVTSLTGPIKKLYEGAEEDGCQFKNCTALQRVSLSYNIPTIPNSCFYAAHILDMFLPYGVAVIGYQAFAMNPLLQELSIPSTVKERGSVDQTFINGCGGIYLYMNTTPDVVLFSGDDYFPGVRCDVLRVPFGQLTAYKNVPAWQSFTEITIGASDISGSGNYSVISLGENGNPGEVKKVYSYWETHSFTGSGTGVPTDIPETVTDDWGRQFTVVELEDSCMAGSYARGVTIPATIRRIGSQAMSNMGCMQSITSQMTTLPEMGSNVWQGINQSNVQLFYPDGTYAAYSTAPQWKNFYMQEPPTEYGLIVNDTKVTSANRTNIPITSGKASYNPVTNTLTLKNAVIDCAARGEEYFPIVSTIDGLTITFEGDCRITGSCVSGLALWGNSTTLNVTDTSNTLIESKYDYTGNLTDGYSFDGIVSDGDVYLTGGGFLNIEVDCDGISCRGTFTIQDARLSVLSTKRTAFKSSTLLVKGNSTFAVCGYQGDMVNTDLQLYDGLAITDPVGARYDSNQKTFVDANGDMIKWQWVVIDKKVGAPTGVQSVAVAQQHTGPLYNLQGQRVNQPQRRGIYIRNGKKLVVK